MTKNIAFWIFSYASLIRLAILDAPTGKATLSEIYNWIRDKFQYYKSSGSGWKVLLDSNFVLGDDFEDFNSFPSQ